MWKPGTLLLLLLWLASGELQQETEPRRLPPPGKLNFGYVPAGVYETLAHYEPGPIGILFHMVHAFLYAVQPNAFPHGKHPQSSSRWLQHNKCRPSPGQRLGSQCQPLSCSRSLLESVSSLVFPFLKKPCLGGIQTTEDVFQRT
uniref:Prominin 1 b n=1 Tax=Haplochromis burtoni TaxID=8153 RepID=A0A3Q2UZF0_HAPBU